MKRFFVLLLVLGAGCGVLWLARGSLAAGRLESKLEELGFVCGALDVEVEADLSRARVSPFECTSEQRRIETFGVDEPIEVTLEWLLPKRVEVPAARVEVRRENIPVDTEGEPFLGRSNIRAPVVRLLRLFDPERRMHFEQVHVGALEITLSEVESLRVHIENVSVEPVSREGAGEEGSEAEDGEGLEVEISVESARIPAGRGGMITFEELAGRVSPETAEVEGLVGGAATIGSLELERSWRFRALVDELNGERPRLSFERL